MGDFLLNYDFEIELGKLQENENYCKEICVKLLQINTEESRKLIKWGISFSLENGLNYAYAYFNYFMARILIERDLAEEAVIYASEAYSSFEEGGYDEEVLMTMNIYMICYMQLEDIETCLQWAVMGMDLAEMTGNQVRLSAFKSNLANLYIDMRNFKDARDVYVELEKLSIAISNENRHSLYIGRAWCEAELENIEDAKAYLEIVKELSNDNSVCIARIHFIEGIILLKEGNLNEAEATLLFSINHIENSGFERDKNEIYLALGKTYLEQNKVEESLKILNYLKDYMEKKERKNFLKEIYGLLEKAYEKIEDYKNAYEYSKKAAKLERELLLKLNNHEIMSLQRMKQEEEAKTYKLLYKQTEMLYGVGNKITSNLNKENIFNIIAAEIQNIINYDIVQIATYSEAKNEFVYEISIEQGQPMNMEGVVIEENTIAGYCIRNKEDILINDIEKESEKYISNQGAYEKYRKSFITEKKNIFDKGAKSAIFIPIVSDKNIIGLATVQSYKSNAYDLKDLTTLKILSTYIGIALENSKLYQMMEYTATHDYLTGLLNRRETIFRSEMLYNNLIENSESIVVIIMDVDNFKSINDTFGHLTGDRVIEAIATTFKDSLEEDAVVGRYGGEEFIAIFKGNPFRDSKSIVENVRINIETLNLRTKDDIHIKTTVSIGMVEVSNNNKSFEDIVGLADKAMYVGKNSGKNILVYEKL